MNVSEDTPKLIKKSLGKIIPLDRIQIIKGFYEETLNSKLPNLKASIVNVDCDYYGSAKVVFAPPAAARTGASCTSRAR